MIMCDDLIATNEFTGVKNDFAGVRGEPFAGGEGHLDLLTSSWIEVRQKNQRCGYILL